MARIAQRVLAEAEQRFHFAHKLAEAMEPHLLQQISQSKIYSYTNQREDRNVPPGDVLLAAALAAGISLDEQLGLVPERRDADMDDMRAEMARMREEVSSLRAELSSRNGGPAEPGSEATDDQAAARARQAAQRREWARRSEAGGSPPGQPAPGARRGSRSNRP